jgi:hypothetical protein
MRSWQQKEKKQNKTKQNKNKNKTKTKQTTQGGVFEQSSKPIPGVQTFCYNPLSLFPSFPKTFFNERQTLSSVTVIGPRAK